MTTAAFEANPLEPCFRINSLQRAVELGLEYATILADPPWPYDNAAANGASANHYASISAEELYALPVAEVAAKNAHLHLWATCSFLPMALQLMEHWGFTYKTHAVWVKEGGFGAGNYWRLQHEVLLLGVRGQLAFSEGGKHYGSVVRARRRRHSEKPNIFRSLIEEVSLPPRLELFAREHSPGWTVFGNQLPASLFCETL